MVSKIMTKKTNNKQKWQKRWSEIVQIQIGWVKMIQIQIHIWKIMYILKILKSVWLNKNWSRKVTIFMPALNLELQNQRSISRTLLK